MIECNISYTWIKILIMDFVAYWFYILHPEHEHLILQSESPNVQKLVNEWHIFAGKHCPRLSLAAYLVHRRIEMMNSKEPIECIFSIENWDGTPLYPSDIALEYGFITDKNVHLLVGDQHRLLYDLDLDEAIEVQEDLLHELIDLDLYTYESLYPLFYHHPLMADNMHISCYGEFTMYKNAVCTVDDQMTILPRDMCAIVARRGVIMPKYTDRLVVLSDYKHTTILHSPHDLWRKDMFIEMIKRRPHIFTTVYPGTFLGHGRYANRVMYMINSSKLPPLWNCALLHSVKENPICKDGIFTCLDQSYIIFPWIRYPFWDQPRTLFTSSKSRAYYTDITISV